MKINIENVIEFFDNPQEKGHTTSIVGIIGEDLNACLFKKYMEEEKGATVEILTNPVTTGYKKGKRLDRWIHVKGKGVETLYQCEIKSWSATAIGGKCIKSNDDVIRVAKYHWERQIKTEFSILQSLSHVTKVLIKMKPPEKYKKVKIEPLVIYWMPICKDAELKPFFSVPVKMFNNPEITESFEKLNIFSVSLYLRNVLKNSPLKLIEVNMPNVENRLKILKDLIIN